VLMARPRHNAAAKYAPSSNPIGHTIFNKSAPATVSFAARFAAPIPAAPAAIVPVQPPPARLNATMLSLRKDACRLSAYAAAQKKNVEPLGALKQVLRVGHGAPAAAGDLLEISYVGWLAGYPSEKFDQGSNFRFSLGTGEVIKGWDEAVLGMREHEVALLTIPSFLAYGTQGSPPAIPPNADLCFEVQLKAIVVAGFASVPSAREHLPQQTPAARGVIDTPAAPMKATRAVSFDPGIPPPSAAACTDPSMYRAKAETERLQRQAEAARAQYAASRPIAGQGDFTRRSFMRM